MLYLSLFVCPVPSEEPDVFLCRIQLVFRLFQLHVFPETPGSERQRHSVSQPVLQDLEPQRAADVHGASRRLGGGGTVRGQGHRLRDLTAEEEHAHRHLLR